ncbi:MAG: metallopeptidase TldD-related protein, partial [Candidatus Cloacimonetes bacterium]|nr:metallopeptidase TldD-related protein [Candidatus Cloacimonadota bacterium]
MHKNLLYLKAELDKHPELKYEIVQNNWQTDFLRFYQSQTNYNISKDNCSLSCELYKGQKIYKFELDSPDPDKIDTALGDAMSIIDSLPEDPDFHDLETDLSLAPPRNVTNNIEAIDLGRKTDILSSIAPKAAEHDFELYGTFICNYSQYRIINSNGLDKRSLNSPIYLEVKAVHNKNQVTVLETFGGEDFAYFDQDAFSARLLSKIIHAKNPVVDVEPGEYEVILAPRCLAEFCQYLSFGMSAWALDQHSSYFDNKVDQKVFPERITITDDPGDPEMIGVDYGSSGYIYRKLDLIDKGVFKAFLCDNYFHHKLGLPKNGNTGSCLKIIPGEHSLEEMISSVKKGLYISSLHYMNFINPRVTSLTGLTRDGTFLIVD